jgi:hypothetical protein
MLPHDEPLTPNQWIARVGKLAGAGQLAPAALQETLGEYAAALRHEFNPAVFTAASALDVARHANNRGFFPTYAQVCEALVKWAKANPVRPSVPALPGPAGAAPAQVERPKFGRAFVARRLSEGADRKHLLSMVRAYDPPAEVRAVMAEFYPADLAAEDEHAAEVRRDKAKAAAAAAVAAALRSPDARRPGVPNPKRQAQAGDVPPEPPPAPPDEPASAPQRTPAEVRELVRTLAMLEQAHAAGVQTAGGIGRIEALRAQVRALRQ